MTDILTTCVAVIASGPTYSWKPDLLYVIVASLAGTATASQTGHLDTEAFEQALVIAQGVYNGNLGDYVEGATHYHAIYVLPEWAETKYKTVQIGDHVFYRWD